MSFFGAEWIESVGRAGMDAYSCLVRCCSPLVGTPQDLRQELFRLREELVQMFRAELEEARASAMQYLSGKFKSP